MSHFSHLPFVVLDKIIREVVEVDQQNLDKWVSSLALLGVCREWRKAASDLVYRNAILYGNNEHSIGFVKHSEDKHIGDKLVNTNIGLIKSTGNTHLVKTLSIEMNYPQYYRSLVNKTNAVFSFGQFNWSNVSKIVIDGWVEDNDIRSHYSAFNIVHETSQFVEQLAKFMPYVSKLDFPIIDQGGLVSSMISQLSTLYSQSLKSLSSYNFLIPTESTHLNQLTTLNINASRQCTAYVPIICRQNLLSLTLRNISASFSWSKLANTCQTNIEFPNLRNLKMFFVAGPDIEETRNASKLTFPLLTHLDIIVPTFDLLVHTMNFEKYQWPNVTNLLVDVREFVFLYEESGELIQRSNILASIIKYCMPRITQIKLGKGECNRNAHFYNALFNLYTEQLTHVSFLHPVPFTKPHFSHELTHLSLKANSDALRSLPKIFAESLRYLQLSGLDSDFSWNMLQDKIASKTISFKHLNRLNIEYSWDSDDSDLDYQQFVLDQPKSNDGRTTVFPRLVGLHIKNATVSRIQKLTTYDSGNWLVMRDLHITIIGSYDTEIPDIINSADYMQSTAMFAKFLVKKMPNISDLNIRTFGDCNEYEKHFCTIVSNSYASQLKKYQCYVPIVFTAYAFSPELRQLFVNIDSANIMPLPRVNAANVEEIYIKGNLNSFTWNSFASDNDPETIIFGNLRSFVAEHSSTNSESTVADHIKSNTLIGKQPFTVHMPKARKISLSGIKYSNGIINASINFTHIDSLNISGSYMATKMFINSSVGKINSCKINATMEFDSDMADFYETTNVLFGNTYKINFAEFVLNTDMSKLCPQHILWTNLHVLGIRTEIKYDMLLKLISKTPKLTKLLLDNIVYDSKSKVMFDSVDPIPTSIAELHMYGAANNESGAINNDHQRYLLMAFPSLTKATVTDVEFESAIFVETYKEAYPHLARIVFE